MMPPPTRHDPGPQRQDNPSTHLYCCEPLLAGWMGGANGSRRCGYDGTRPQQQQKTTSTMPTADDNAAPSPTLAPNARRWGVGMFFTCRICIVSFKICSSVEYIE